MGLLVARLLSDLGLGNHVPVALRRWVLGRASERTVNAGLSSIPDSQLMRRLLKVCLSPPPQRILRIVRSVGLQGRGKERYLRFCMSQNQNIHWVLLTQDCQGLLYPRLPGGRGPALSVELKREVLSPPFTGNHLPVSNICPDPHSAKLAPSMISFL